jgi:CO dehydrogenase/acetyl-CoA synthase epsilon subunit
MYNKIVKIIILNLYIQISQRKLKNLSKKEFLIDLLDILDFATETDNQYIKKPP